LLPEAAGFDIWFERRSIDDIIDGLRRVGNLLAVEFLEHWKKGPGDEFGKTTQAVLKEHRSTAFKKLTDLLLHPDPDNNLPTHSLDDSAYPLEDSFLWPPTVHTWEGGGAGGMTSASSTTWSTSLGPCRLRVHQEPVGERWRCQAAPRTLPRLSRRARQGSAQEEAPLPSAGPSGATDAPPAPKALSPYRQHPRSPSRTLPCSQWGLQFIVLRETGDTVTGTFLSAFYVDATPGSAASAAKHDETSMKSPAPHTLNLFS
jgi:hypothetical protein